MTDIDDIYRIGDIVVAQINHINPLVQYSEQLKQAQNIMEPMPIDINWRPPFILEENSQDTRVFLCNGDPLKILSKALTAPDAPYYIFQVEDRDKNTYYVSCKWFGRHDK